MTDGKDLEFACSSVWYPSESFPGKFENHTIAETPSFLKADQMLTTDSTV